MESPMPKINIKSLIGKLNETCRKALESAAGLCLSQTHYEVDIEHFLIKLLEIPDTDLGEILQGLSEYAAVESFERREIRNCHRRRKD